MIAKKMRYKTIKRMSNAKPSLWIGKNGITQAIIEDVNKQLEKKEVLKIKVLKKGLVQTTMKDLAALLVDETGAELLQSRGHSLILYKKNNKE